MGIVVLAEILKKQNEEDTGGNSASVRMEKNRSYPEQQSLGCLEHQDASSSFCVLQVQTYKVFKEQTLQK